MLRVLIMSMLVSVVMLAPSPKNPALHDEGEVSVNDVTFEMQSPEVEEVTEEEPDWMEPSESDHTKRHVDVMEPKIMRDEYSSTKSYKKREVDSNEMLSDDQVEEDADDDEIERMQEVLDNMDEQEMEEFNNDMKRLLSRARRHVRKAEPFCSGNRLYLPQCSGARPVAAGSQQFVSGGGNSFVDQAVDFSSQVDSASVGGDSSGATDLSQEQQEFGDESISSVRFSHDDCETAVKHTIRTSVSYLPVTVYNTGYELVPTTLVSTVTATVKVPQPSFFTIVRTTTLANVVLTSTHVQNQVKHVQATSASTVTSTVTSTKNHLFSHTTTVRWIKTEVHKKVFTTTSVKNMDVSRDESDLRTEVRYHTVFKTNIITRTVTSTATKTRTVKNVITHVAHQYRYVPVTLPPVYVTVNTC